MKIKLLGPFPSPCGEKVGINVDNYRPYTNAREGCFRPLAGKR